MMMWEYRNLLCDAEGDGVQFPGAEDGCLISPHGLHSNVATMGRDGWELASHVVAEGVQSFWFKRPLDELPSATTQD